MTDIHTGGCQCGALRYRFNAPFNDVAHCHCSMCRRTSGAVVTTWFTVPLERFEWTQGTPQGFVSSPGCTRSFCPTCGAHLTFHTEHSPQTIDITVGTLDHPDQAKPDRHIWVTTRLPWLHLDEHLPSEDGEST